MDTKITFADLDQMVDYWATDLSDYQCIFHNQLTKLNSIFWEVGCNNIKTAMIERKLGILHYMHKQLEDDLLNASVFENNLEQLIIKLENQLTASEGNDFLDSTIYGLCERANINLNCLKNEVELIISDIKNIEKDNLKNPIEHIAKIMTALLQTLEHIEAKTECMKNKMHWIDREIKSILCESHHKN